MYIDLDTILIYLDYRHGTLLAKPSEYNLFSYLRERQLYVVAMLNVIPSENQLKTYRVKSNIFSSFPSHDYAVMGFEL